MDEDPATAVTVGLRPHPVTAVSPLGVATTKPAGKVSTNDSPEIVVVTLMLKVRDVVPPTAMLTAPNDLVGVTGVCANRWTLATSRAPRIRSPIRSRCTDLL